MAYAAVKTYTEHTVNGRRCLLVTVAETEGAAASEYTIDLGKYIPTTLWRLVRVKLVKTAGSLATMAPVFGTATNPATGTADYVGGISAAASHDSTNSSDGWTGDGNTLYCRTVPNAGADNSVTSRWYFMEAWQA